MFQYNSIVPVLILTTIHVTQANIVPTKYKKLQPGKNITRTVVAELTTRSRLQCSDRCSAEVCKAYQYKGTRPGNCLLIQNKCSENDDNTFTPEEQNIIYEKVRGAVWRPPVRWNSPLPVVYRSFNDECNIQLMNGAQLVPGKAGAAVRTDHLQSQWVDLCVLTEACITLPETCGPEGAAVGFWVKLIEGHGIISSYNGATGFLLRCESGLIMAFITLPGGRFYVGVDKRSGWTHIVLNYIGPEDRQGIQIYLDGNLTESDTTKTPETYSPGDGRVVVGRTNTRMSHHYASLEVDELIFFNNRLNVRDVRLIYSKYLD